MENLGNSIEYRSERYDFMDVFVLGTALELPQELTKLRGFVILNLDPSLICWISDDLVADDLGMARSTLDSELDF